MIQALCRHQIIRETKRQNYPQRIQHEVLIVYKFTIQTTNNTDLYRKTAQRRPWVHYSVSNPIQSTVHSVGENTIKYVSEFDPLLQLMLHVDS